MNQTLTRLLNAARPYRKFTVTIGDEQIELFARVPSTAVSENISREWEQIYATELAVARANPDASALEDLKRLSPDHLSLFIAKADRRDLAMQASAENDDKPTEDPVVKERTEELIKERRRELVESVPEDRLLELAIERRAHFAAVSKANQFAARNSLIQNIFTLDKEPLFTSLEDLEEIPASEIFALMKAMNTALTPPSEAKEKSDDTPLESASPQ